MLVLWVGRETYVHALGRVGHNVEPRERCERDSLEFHCGLGPLGVQVVVVEPVVTDAALSPCWGRAAVVTVGGDGGVGGSPELDSAFVALHPEPAMDKVVFGGPQEHPISTP